MIAAWLFSARALWGSKIAIVQTGATLGSSVQSVSPKEELYEDAEDSFSCGWSRRLYSQTPLLFWQAKIAIGSLATVMIIYLLILNKPINVQL